MELFFFICGSIFPGFHESSAAAPFAAALFHRSGAAEEREAAERRHQRVLSDATLFEMRPNGLRGNSASVGVI